MNSYSSIWTLIIIQFNFPKQSSTNYLGIIYKKILDPLKFKSNIHYVLYLQPTRLHSVS